ncbi:MAG TPA: hypothetical protein VGN63_12340 [Flavisolibacter sp.]|jgi:hypothetical protein|nr:hypothetical protein [Flavisolibacter sp.]
MKTTCVQFKSLEDLAQFRKVIKTGSYTIDTSALTLKAFLSELETAIAVEEYSARVLRQTNLQT